MTEYIKYQIKNIEPLRIADDSTSQNGQTTTLRYIPGTTIRGWIINQLAKRADFENLKKDLFSDNVRYLNAYINKDEKSLLPSPKGFYEDKTVTEGKKKIENVVLRGDFTEGYKRASLGRFSYMDEECIHYYSVDTNSDMKIKINLNEGEKQNVFRNEYISPGYCFSGYIAVNDHETGEMIKQLFTDRIILGNARSAGFGKCEVLSSEITEQLPYEEYLPEKEQKNSCYMMLLSNTAFIDQNGEICGFTEETLEALENKMGVQNLNIAFCATSTVQVRGYNRSWGIKIPSLPAYEQGSVFHFTYDGVLSPENMRKLADTGIGIRINEGFGRVLFLKDYEKIQYKCAEKYFDDSVREKKTELTKEDSKVLRTIARSYYKNKLERKMQEYVLKASHEKSFWGTRTSNSQLGELDSRITANKSNPQEAKTAIYNYLEHANEKEETNSVQKVHNSLKKTKKYVDQLYATDLEELLGFSGKQKGYVMGIPVSELMSQTEKDALKLELLTSLIRFKNKGDK